MSEVTTVSNEALRGYWQPVAFARDVTDEPAVVYRRALAAIGIEAA